MVPYCPRKAAAAEKALQATASSSKTKLSLADATLLLMKQAEQDKKQAAQEKKQAAQEKKQAAQEKRQAEKAAKEKAEKAAKEKADADNIRFGKSLVNAGSGRTKTAAKAKEPSSSTKDPRGKKRLPVAEPAEAQAKKPKTRMQAPADATAARIQKFMEGGCGKCRYKPGCTPSCWSARNMAMPARSA